MKQELLKDKQFYKFSAYGFLKNLRFFDPYIILFFLEMGINYAQIGILFSIREIFINLMELPTGIVADSYGKRRSMILSFVSYIISFFIFYFFPNFWIYIIAMLFFSLGEAFRTGTHKAMILTYLELKGIKEQKVNYYGHTRSASQFGSAISSLIAMGLVFFNKSYKIVFLASIIPYIIELFLMISYPKELDGDIRLKSKGFWKELIVSFKETTLKFFKIIRNYETLKALLTSSVFSGLYKGSKDYIQPMIKSYAISMPILLAISSKQRVTIVIGIVYFFIYLMTSYASKKSGRFAKRFENIESGVNLTYVFGVILLFLSGLLLMFKYYVLSILVFISIYILENLRKPLNVGLISDKIKTEILATGLSGESQLKTIFTALFSFLIGVITQLLGLDFAIILISLIAILIYPFIRLKF